MASFAEAPCSICIEDFNNSTRARVTCPNPSCEFTCCRTCIRTYLLTTIELPHCMKCKTRWERDMLIRATLTSYVNGDYKKHRKSILFDMEKSRLPETMPAVQNFLKIEELRNEAKAFDERFAELRTEMYLMKHRKDIARANIARAKQGQPLINHAGGVGEKVVKKVFKQACPAEDCRGFLSTAWKCGMCASWVCSKCLVLKGKEKDDGHECNPDDVKTADLIRSQTKNCPSCAVPIEKISGCDQMWCTQCHVAFSWKTGQRVNGVVHNPHFYQWQAQGGGALQPPGAQVCGGLPTAWRLRQNLERCVFADRGGRMPSESRLITEPDLRPWKTTVESIQHLHRGMRHFTHWELERVREKANRVADNRDLRIKFITKAIDKPNFQKQIVSRDKQREKNLAILQVYELINTVFTESIRDVWETVPGPHAHSTPSLTKAGRAKKSKQVLETITRNMERCEKLRLYANKELIKISVMYSQKVGLIDREYYTQSKKFKKKDLSSIECMAMVADNKVI